MQIFVAARETSTLDVCPNATVGDLKEILAFTTGVATDEQILTFGGHPLDGEQTLAENGVNALSTISLSVALRGGRHY